LKSDLIERRCTSLPVTGSDADASSFCNATEPGLQDDADFGVRFVRVVR
jgi:hypothetical protein